MLCKSQASEIFSTSKTIIARTLIPFSNDRKYKNIIGCYLNFNNLSNFMKVKSFLKIKMLISSKGLAFLF